MGDPARTCAPPPRLPRAIELAPEAAAIRAALAAQRRLRAGGSVAAPVVALDPGLASALGAAARGGHVRRGLEATEAALEAEARGLRLLPAREAGRHGGRVSRLCLVSEDGAERFYRRVERLVLAHAPRVLVVLVACDAATLGRVLFGSGATAKLALLDHKAAVAAVLRALARPSGSPVGAR